MDAELWFRDWAIQQEGFPPNYLVLDIETTGADLSADLVLQIGWCKVLDHRVVENKGVLLNWHKSPHVDPTWIKNRMRDTAKSMQALGRVYPFCFDDLKSGVNPIYALAEFLDLLAEARANEHILVAHNGATFDMPVLTNHFRKFLKLNYVFRPEEVWDTGALEKAVQLDELLCEHELPGDFAYRVIMRSGDGVSWNLHEHCAPKYDLVERFRLNMMQSHTAPFDAYVTHLLLEEFHALAKRGFDKCP